MLPSRQKRMLKTGLRFLTPIRMPPPPAKKPRLDAPSFKKPKKVKPTKSSDDILHFDILDLLGPANVESLKAQGKDVLPKRFDRMQEIELDIVALSSHGESLSLKHANFRNDSLSPGDGLGVTAEKDWVVVVPFCLPGERVRAKVYRNEALHSFADLVSVVKPNDGLRDESLIQCKYFGSCGGCQVNLVPLDLRASILALVISTKCCPTRTNLITSAKWSRKPSTISPA